MIGSLAFEKAPFFQLLVQPVEGIPHSTGVYVYTYTYDYAVILS